MFFPRPILILASIEDDKGQLQVSGNVDCYQATGILDIACNLLKADRTVSLPESEHDGCSLDSKRDREDEERSNANKETLECILDRLFGNASTDFDKQDVSIPYEVSIVEISNFHQSSKEKGISSKRHVYFILVER